MKLSLTSLKISIAGAKLCHLVQKDKIWDHGSMIEQVRTVFILLKKSFHRRDPEIIKKCMTDTAYKTVKYKIQQATNDGHDMWYYDLKEIYIVTVAQGKNGDPDKFTASLKFKTNEEEDHASILLNKNRHHSIEQQWLFMRQGEWWLLNEIITKKQLQLFQNLLN